MRASSATTASAGPASTTVSSLRRSSTEQPLSSCSASTVAPLRPIRSERFSSSTLMRATPTGPMPATNAPAASTPSGSPNTRTALAARSDRTTTAYSARSRFRIHAEESSSRSSADGDSLRSTTASGERPSSTAASAREDASRAASKSAKTARKLSVSEERLLRTSSKSLSHSAAWRASSFIRFISSSRCFSSLMVSVDRSISSCFARIRASTSCMDRLFAPVGLCLMRCSRLVSSALSCSLSASACALSPDDADV
mmetsp:Transcript_3749/g.12612  ORF Transcript_3749/g.12612 Transcript_3749/m.12612 type:complete len:256 (-) Transcript_3749:164-931(-)